MTPPVAVELVYFTGCPHVSHTREALREALKSLGLPERWQEWNQLDPSSPAWVQAYPSPTILVAGQDVSGEAGPVGAKACRIDGLGSTAMIREAILREVTL